MPLAPGSRLGGYEIVGSLGAGGMGEVYRARDSRLGRSVALKVLPAAFESDPDRVPRFEREAKVLASLNHPHIAALYGMEQAEGSNAHFLIMELVEGETLFDRLERGALPVSEALAVAIQIADALETAHDQGVVHRDLKPANVKITPDDKVKVLDFGLAKAMDSSPVASSPANSPTLSVMATQAGLIMGTAAYMSPEQAKGLAIDRRSDVFSFGVVLYELLSGRQPFGGVTAAEIMASVMLQEADLSSLPSGLNPRLIELVKRCLEKSPKKRWQSMGDLRLELEAIAVHPFAPAASSAAVTAPWWQRAVPVAAAAVIAAVIATFATRALTPAPSREVLRFTVPSPSMIQGNTSLAWTPDGSAVAYFKTDLNTPGQRQLMVRRLDDFTTRPISGTEGPNASAAFSPDGTSVVFFAGMDSTLKIVPVTGGVPATLAKIELPYSGPVWHAKGILYSQPGGIYRVSPGSAPELVVKADNELLASPHYLNDRGDLLFTALAVESLSPDWEHARVVVQHANGTREVIVTGGTDARYTSGYLTYLSGARLMAMPFDASSGRATGSAAPVIDGVARAAVQRFGGHFALSPGGSLAYLATEFDVENPRRKLALVGPDGKALPLDAAADYYTHPRVSPDGKQVVVAIDHPRDSAISLIDLTRNTAPRRLTFGGGTFSDPIWSPDSQWITYRVLGDGKSGVFRQRADGNGVAEQLTAPSRGQVHYPETWSADGKTLILRVATDAGNSLWSWSEADRTPKPLLQAGTSTVTAEYSRDGKWVAYGSNELNPAFWQVFVQPYPLTGAKYQVNAMASSAPVWSADGTRLLFAYSNKIFSVPIQTTPSFSAATATELALPAILPSAPTARHYDLLPDGKRLIVVLAAEADRSVPPRQLSIVLNWIDELKSKATQPQ